MNVSKEEFVREIKRRMDKKKQLKIDTSYNCFKVREYGIGRVTHGRCKAHEV